MTRTRILAALVAGLTLTGLGTAAAALGSDDPARTVSAAPVAVVSGGAARTTTTTASASTSSPTSTSTPTSTTAPSAAGAVDGDDAGRIAVQHLGGGTVTKIERETEHGRRVWEVDVRGTQGTTEVHVDAAGGTVSRVEGRDDRGRDDDSGRGRGRGGDDRGGDDRGGDDRGGRHGSDDGPSHDLYDDHGGDR